MSTLLRLFVLLLLLIASVPNLHAQSSGTSAPAGGTPTGRIRGVVFDSLLMGPVKGASVTLLGRSETVTSDERGRFGFDNVPAGPQTVVFEAAEFDSLGLGTMGTTITLAANETANIGIGPPSIHTLWQRRCTTALSADSGIVWGTIRDSRTNKLLSGAVAAFSWYDMRGGPAPGIYLSDIRREVLTDESGLYFACGIPTEMVITSAAIDTSTVRGKGASGFIEYAVGSRRLQRLDMTISADMIAPVNAAMTTPEDSAAANRARGRATLRGTVVDDKNLPVQGATVLITSADTSVVTNATGGFVLSGLPAGTHAIQTKRVGFAPVNQIVALRADSVTEVQVISGSVNVLSVYNVRAESNKASDRVAFDLRRRAGLGSFAESKDFARRIDMAAMLRQFSGIRVDGSGSKLVVTANALFGKRCVPGVYLDGMYSTFETVALMKPQDFRAVEVYARASAAPAQYATFTQCGVILFWSNSARW